jgi:hypothetical protein
VRPCRWVGLPQRIPFVRRTRSRCRAPASAQRDIPGRNTRRPGGMRNGGDAVDVADHAALTDCGEGRTCRLDANRCTPPLDPHGGNRWERPITYPPTTRRPAQT